MICAIQVHVLCYTVFVLLKNLLPVLKPGDLSVCRKSLQDVSILFNGPLLNLWHAKILSSQHTMIWVNFDSLEVERCSFEVSAA